MGLKAQWLSTYQTDLQLNLSFVQICNSPAASLQETVHPKIHTSKKNPKDPLISSIKHIPDFTIISNLSWDSWSTAQMPSSTHYQSKNARNEATNSTR